MTQLLTIVECYQSSKLFMCIREKEFEDTLPFFLCVAKQNVMRDQGESTEVLKVSQNWLSSHSCNSGHVVSPIKGKTTTKLMH